MKIYTLPAPNGSKQEMINSSLGSIPNKDVHMGQTAAFFQMLGMKEASMTRHSSSLLATHKLEHEKAAN
jgi:hypothetical protein